MANVDAMRHELAVNGRIEFKVLNKKGELIPYVIQFSPEEHKEMKKILADRSVGISYMHAVINDAIRQEAQY